MADRRKVSQTIQSTPGREQPKARKAKQNASGARKEKTPLQLIAREAPFSYTHHCWGFPLKS
jgi:hypothetical protein